MTKKELNEAAIEVLSGKTTLNESFTDVDKLDLSEYPTNAINIIKTLRKNKVKVGINQKTLEGVAVYHGVVLAFYIGSENFSFNLGDLFVKGGQEETIKAMLKFLDVVWNYGGQSKKGKMQ